MDEFVRPECLVVPVELLEGDQVVALPAHIVVPGGQDTTLNFIVTFELIIHVY